jgi:protein-L-isoaspartate(D-aspartate) O-methyltransferase
MTGADPEAVKDARVAERRAMVREVMLEGIDTAAWIGRGGLDPRALAALERVPRHEFVPPERQHLAYVNAALPIGRGQTISQPYVVALMTSLARLERDHVVLEVGTGSGYQAAVLAELSDHVLSIEFDPELAAEARRRLDRLGYARVATRVGDGSKGWPERAPFDAILVTAAGRSIPPALLAQLRPGGRLVLPLERNFLHQELVVVEKDAEGRTTERMVLPVAFVPLRGGAVNGAATAPR